MNKKLKAKIVEHYGTLIEFSYDLHERPSFVSHVIHGKATLSSEKIEKWSRALHCDIEVFLSKADM
jgi:hypothetical protein